MLSGTIKWAVLAFVSWGNCFPWYICIMLAHVPACLCYTIKLCHDFSTGTKRNGFTAACSWGLSILRFTDLCMRMTSSLHPRTLYAYLKSLKADFGFGEYCDTREIMLPLLSVQWEYCFTDVSLQQKKKKRSAESCMGPLQPQISQHAWTKCLSAWTQEGRKRCNIMNQTIWLWVTQLRRLTRGLYLCHA